MPSMPGGVRDMDGDTATGAATTLPMPSKLDPAPTNREGSQDALV